MPCRVGITTNPERRKREWASKLHGMRGWRILKSCTNRKQAQRLEREYAVKYGCKAYGGGNRAKGPWCVYKFEYTRSK